MNQIEQVEIVVDETNVVSIPDSVRASLIADLKPIAHRMEEYTRVAAQAKCTNEHEANTLAGVIKCIDADLKAVESCDVLSRTISGLHSLHRKWTAARALFTDPLNRDKRTIRGCVVAWQNEQARIAAERQRQLQAEADAKARAERERLEAKAAKYKTEEKREAMLAQAATVIAPTVTVEAPKAIGTRRVWKITDVNLPVLLAAAATDSNLQGYIEVSLTRLERAKAANPGLTVPGVVFEHQVK